MTRDVDVALEKDLAELANGSTWLMADRLVDAFPPDEYGNAEHGTKTDLWKALDALSDALRHDYGIDLKVKTLSNYRATALAWPEGARAPSAPYRVHEMAKARPDRVKLVEKLIRKHGGRLTERQFRDWKAAQHPQMPEPWVIRIERRLRAIVNEAHSPAARLEVADILDRLSIEFRG